MSNAFSVITLDLLRGERTVKTIRYNPVSGAFTFTAQETLPIEIAASGVCKVGELALAMEQYSPSLSPLAHYLSALLLDAKSEVPIQTENGHTFGSFAVLEAQPDTDLRSATVKFMAFQNVLRVFYTRFPLSDIFAKYGSAVTEYGTTLEGIIKVQPDLEARLIELENDSRLLAATEPQVPFSHASALFVQLAEEHEWNLLRAQAERHLSSPDEALAFQAKRMLALSLAQSKESADTADAIKLYRELIQENAEPSDAGNLAMLLIEIDDFEDAKTTVIHAIEEFPFKMTDYFRQIGLKIVEATGDRDFRKQLETAAQARGKRD